MPRQAEQYDSQLPLFSPPMARRSDPDSSHEAADEHESSGRAEVNRERVLRALRMSWGFTSRELAPVAELERHEVARRLSELRDSYGLATNKTPTGLQPRSEKHPDGYPGQLRWWPV